MKTDPTLPAKSATRPARGVAAALMALSAALAFLLLVTRARSEPPSLSDLDAALARLAETSMVSGPSESEGEAPSEFHELSRWFIEHGSMEQFEAMMKDERAIVRCMGAACVAAKGEHADYARIEPLFSDLAEVRVGSAFWQALKREETPASERFIDLFRFPDAWEDGVGVSLPPRNERAARVLDEGKATVGAVAFHLYRFPGSLGNKLSPLAKAWVELNRAGAGETDWGPRRAFNAVPPFQRALRLYLQEDPVGEETIRFLLRASDPVVRYMGATLAAKSENGRHRSLLVLLDSDEGGVFIFDGPCTCAYWRMSDAAARLVASLPPPGAP
jgi:hypothetical protein